MENSCSIIIVLWYVVCLVICVSHRRNGEIIGKYNIRTGEAIADDDSIQKYKLEHQKFHKEETRDDTLLKWPGLDSENLNNYCKKYLQYLIPKRNTNNATGTKMERTLCYAKENKSNNSRIVTVTCTVMRKHPMSILAIINKHCDFEGKKFQKQKRAECSGGVYKKLGQLIANPEYLEKYELDHQKLYNTERKLGNFLEWPYAITHRNLDSFCYHYMRKCAPGRKSEGVTGSWEPANLHYEKLKTIEDIVVITVKCKLPTVRQRYYITRALETNCVYSLHRKGLSQFSPLAIIFKYCDFEDLSHQETTSQDYCIPVENVIPKIVA